MGLDGVELVMAVEEKFGIQIADEEAQNIRTPRQFYDAVEKKIRTVPADVCLTQRAFYLLRRTFRDEFAVSRKAFRPEILLESLIPRENRKIRWEQLRRQTGALSWPRLRFPQLVSATLGTILLAIAAAAYIWAGPGAMQRAIIIALATAITALVLIPLAAPLRVSFGGQTVGSLAEFIVTSNSFLVAPGAEDWTRERIRLQVRQIIVDQLAVSPDFSDDADFVEDLGVD
ncbi:MAG TPA: hypothetical protein VF135_11005 [Terriglobales bacterium]